MQTNNDLPPTLERYLGTNVVEQMQNKLDSLNDFDRLNATAQETNRMLVEVGLNQLEPKCIISIGIKRIMTDEGLESAIKAIQDYSILNKRQIQKLLGKNLLQVILNCK